MTAPISDDEKAAEKYYDLPHSKLDRIDPRVKPQIEAFLAGASFKQAQLMARIGELERKLGIARDALKTAHEAMSASYHWRRPPDNCNLLKLQEDLKQIGE